MQHFSPQYYASDGACILQREVFCEKNITNHHVVAAHAVCWVHFSLSLVYFARGALIWDGWKFKINMMHDLKSPNFVFLLPFVFGREKCFLHFSDI